MQPINIFLMFILGYFILLTMSYGLSEQENRLTDMRVKRSLENKRFYDFGSRSINIDDENLQNLDDAYVRHQRFYDFGSRKRFYDFGSKKRSQD